MLWTERLIIEIILICGNSREIAQEFNTENVEATHQATLRSVGARILNF